MDPHRFTRPRPIHHPEAASDAAVVILSVQISGGIHLNLCIKHLLFFVKEQLLCPVIFLHRTIFMPFTDTRNAVRVTSTRRPTRQHHLIIPWTTRPSALAAGSRVHASLQRRGRLAVHPGLQTSRWTHPSAPVYHVAAGSPVSDFNFT